MSNYHFYVVEIELPLVGGTCTIDGNLGYGTPLTCDDQAPNFNTYNYSYKFTDTNLPIGGEVYKAVKSISETTPQLKAGNGVGSRATATINFSDFIGDPNISNLLNGVDDPVYKQGTFFGKLKQRNIIANKPVRIKYFRSYFGQLQFIETHHYIATDFKRNSNGDWTLVCKDALYKADDTKSQFPKVVTGRLYNNISASTTFFTMSADIADWAAYDDYVAVIGDEICIITNATGTATAVTLTVQRQASITLGSRLIENTPAEHKSGDEVFRGRKYVNADLYNILEDVFLDSGITTSEYDGAGMQTELDSWLGSLDNSIDCIFYESKAATDVLNTICKTFLIDIWTDVKTGKVSLKANSPWQDTVATLNDGVEIVYNSVVIDEPDSLQYSRAFLQYDKRKLTSNDDDVNFKRSAVAVAQELEGVYYYNEEKVKVLPKSIILSNKANNVETASLSAVRFVQRFNNRPQTFKFDIEETNLNFDLADVVEIVTPENQGNDGSPKTGVRAQVVKISPKNKTGRLYTVDAITYNPFGGGIAGQDINVISNFDINLFTEAGGPTVADTFNFIFNGNYGVQNGSIAVQVGSFPSGSIINIVLLNGSYITARGGKGGNGLSYYGIPEQGVFQFIPESAGGNGGQVIDGTSGTTVNVYLNGNTGDLGNGSYTADGYLYAPAGGGGGNDGGGNNNGGDGGGGGAGLPAGLGGIGGNGGDSGDLDGQDGEAGTLTLGGAGGTATGVAGDGGDSGENGVSSSEAGGLAGKALVNNGSTINVLTNGQTTRFKQGSGDAPNSIT